MVARQAVLGLVALETLPALEPVRRSLLLLLFRRRPGTVGQPDRVRDPLQAGQVFDRGLGIVLDGQKQAAKIK